MRALDASRGKFVKTTEAAMVSGASVVSSSSGILSSWAGVLARDMMCRQQITLVSRTETLDPGTCDSSVRIEQGEFYDR